MYSKYFPTSFSWHMALAVDTISDLCQNFDLLQCHSFILSFLLVVYNLYFFSAHSCATYSSGFGLMKFLGKKKCNKSSTYHIDSTFLMIQVQEGFVNPIPHEPSVSRRALTQNQVRCITYTRTCCKVLRRQTPWASLKTLVYHRLVHSRKGDLERSCITRETFF